MRNAPSPTPLQSSLDVAQAGDLLYFAAIAKHGSFTAASHALGISKSLLSRHIDALEKSLGVRLIERSTRRLALSESGRRLLPHCQAMLLELDAAHDAVAESHSHPRGKLRVGCPISVSLHIVGPLLPRFMQRYPDIQLEMVVSNRVADLYDEELDLALRVRSEPDEPGSVIVKTLAHMPIAIVAAPSLLQRHPVTKLDDLDSLPTLDVSSRLGQHRWMLTMPDGKRHAFEHHPRLISDDLDSLRLAALDGLGAAALPKILWAEDVAAGRLKIVLPRIRLPQTCYYAVMLSRSGMRPTVRAFLDFLDETRHETRGMAAPGVTHPAASTARVRRPKPP